MGKAVRPAVDHAGGLSAYFGPHLCMAKGNLTTYFDDADTIPIANLTSPMRPCGALEGSSLSRMLNRTFKRPCSARSRCDQDDPLDTHGRLIIDRLMSLCRS